MKMKVAAAYTGRSMSQPVLLNRLNDEIDIELHLFKDHPEDVDILDFDYEHYSLEVDNVKIRGQTALWITQDRVRKKWTEFMSKNVTDDFDLVIGMNNLATPAVDVANEYDIPSLFFIRNLEVTGQEIYQRDRGHIENFLAANFGAKIQYPFFVKNFREYKRGMEETDKVIANSKYVSDRLNNDFGVDSEVVYPPINFDEYRVDNDEDGYIAAVNPRNREKGADIFFDIVRSMPSEEFLSAGSYRDSSLRKQAESLDNLTHMGYCEDMREFYSQVKLVVVPSRWNEAFGRAAAEAMINGIPLVVSDRGGLPEIVGDAGEIVSDIESPDAWVEAIHRALNNHDPDAQKKRAERFSAENQGNELVSIIESIME